MAEYMLRARLGSNSGWETTSAGLSAIYGAPASETAIEVLKEHGIDIRPHRSRPVNKESVDAASLIVVMTASHRDQIQALYPDATEKVFLLKSFDSSVDGGDIEDPIGLSIDMYCKIRDEIDAALPGLVEFMNSLDV